MTKKAPPSKRIAIKPSANTKIWRYMDFPKFMSIIQHKHLFFPAMKNLNDKFDGSLAILGIVSIASLDGRQGSAVENHPTGPRSNIFVTCWHMNENESAAMWAQYAPYGAGIAVLSSVGRLESSTDWTKYKTVEMGKVNYRPKPIKDGKFNTIQACFYKRPSFEHEKEFRIVLSPPVTTPLTKYVQQNGGIYVPVDLTLLIEKIYIAPFVPAWFGSLVMEIVQKQYALDIPVIKSEIDKEPFKN